MNVKTKIPHFPEVKCWPAAKDTKGEESFVKGFMIMRFPLLLFVLSPIVSVCQPGLHIRYQFGQSKTLDTVLISQNGLQASVEYGFRLKEKRIEFHPGLGYRFTSNTSQHHGYISSLDLDLNTAIYPFDFGGDCDCPTFSKDGNLVKKGFFFELSPGVGYQILHRLRSDPDNPSKLPVRSKNIVWKIGGATGLDIGISEQFTLTPMISATILSASEWEGLRQDASSGTLDDYMYFGAGMRLAYNADPKRKRRF